ncbi:hypothetical protein KC872_04675, partial [Candidatus Kaiserbacteria bacterium]|nr:hypothetical protein [Candidatus Kaiserbacteria bacterium]
FISVFMLMNGRDSDNEELVEDDTSEKIKIIEPTAKNINRSYDEIVSEYNETGGIEISGSEYNSNREIQDFVDLNSKKSTLSTETQANYCKSRPLEISTSSIKSFDKGLVFPNLNYHNERWGDGDTLSSLWLSCNNDWSRSPSDPITIYTPSSSCHLENDFTCNYWVDYNPDEKPPFQVAYNHVDSWAVHESHYVRYNLDPAYTLIDSRKIKSFDTTLYVFAGNDRYVVLTDDNTFSRFIELNMNMELMTSYVDQIVLRNN